MSAVDLQLVRECFELSRFRVMTHWRQETDAFQHEARPLLFIENTRPTLDPPNTTVLRREDLGRIERAVVDVRAWHGDRFYASVFEANPILGRTADPECAAAAADYFNGAPYATILVISELPASNEPRARALEAFAKLGIHHLIEFSAIIEEAARLVNAYGDYSASAPLQTLRLLKRYGLLRRQQLEFEFPTFVPIPATPPVVETTEVSPEISE